MGNLFDRRYLPGLFLVVGLLAANVAISLWSLNQLHGEAKTVAHTHEVLSALDQLQSHAANLEAAHRGYIVAGDDRSLDQFNRSKALLPPLVMHLDALARDNEFHQEKISDVRLRVDKQIQTLEGNIRQRREVGLGALRDFVLQERDRREAQSISDLVASMRQHEFDLLEARRERSEASYRLGIVSIAGAGMVGLGMVGAFTWQALKNLFHARRSAARLFEERERLQVTLLSIGDAVITTDGGGKIDFLNQAAVRLIDWPEAEALGKDLSEVFRLVRASTGEPVESSVLHALREGAVVASAEPILLESRRGGRRSIEENAAPIRDSENRVIGAVLVFRDVTERRRSEQSLLEARAYAESIVATLREALVVLTPQHRIRSANQAFYDMFALTREETERSSFYELSASGTGGSRFRQLFEEVLPNQKSSENFEFEQVIPGRGKRSFLANARRLVGAEEESDLTLLAIEDITERKRAQEEVRRLLDLEKERSQRLRQLAEASRAIYLANSLESVEGVVVAEVKRLVGARDAAVVAAGDAPREEHARDNDSIVAPLAARGGSHFGRIVASHPIGGPFSAEDQSILEQLANVAAVAVENTRFYDELRERDRRKDEFLAMLAHELRNPLAPICSSLEVMRRLPPTDPAARSSQETIERQVRQMVRLIDDLLDLSRISQGRIELRHEHIDLLDVLDAAAEATLPLFAAKNQELRLDVAAEPIWIVGDATRLTQVFGNLFNNASKYSPRGSATVVRAEVGAEQVSVHVRDEGIGIAAEALPRVFEMFTRIESSDAGTPEGLGVGLSLAHSLVEMHRGTLEARSEGIGRGSEFIVRLPTAPPPARFPDAPSEEEAPPIAPQRILVVDDNQDAAESLAELLRLSGHEVCTARDGNEALEAAANFHPAVVLLDIGLPGINGYEVARRLREHDTQPPTLLIAMTGWGQAEDRRRSREAGFDHHLVKPVEPAMLDQLLRWTIV